jgi:hypothetical protein
MKTIKVRLAGKEYELKPLPIRKAREVRQRFIAPINELIEAIKRLPKIDLTDMQSIGMLVESVQSSLLNSTDICLEILLLFSPEMVEDRERIEDEGYEEEVIAAFVEALKMLYPFGGMLKSLSGLAALATSTSSASASGDGGQMS